MYAQAVLLLVLGFLFSPMFLAAGILLWAAGGWLFDSWHRRRHPPYDVRLLPYRPVSIADEAEHWLRTR